MNAPGVGGPDADGRVETAGSDAISVESDCVDLMVVTAEDLQALPGVDVPELKVGVCASSSQRSRSDEKDSETRSTYAAGAVVAPAHDLVACDFDAPHRVLMAREEMDQFSLLDVPDAEGRITRAGDDDRPALEDLQASNGGGVAVEDVQASPEDERRKGTAFV